MVRRSRDYAYFKHNLREMMPITNLPSKATTVYFLLERWSDWQQIIPECSSATILMSKQKRDLKSAIAAKASQ